MTIRFSLLFLAVIFSPTLVAAADSSCLVTLKSLSEPDLKPSTPQKVAMELFKAAGINIDGPGVRDLIVSDPEFYKKFLSDPDLQLGETYMDGIWDSPAIDQITYKIMSYLQQTDKIKVFLPMLRTPRLAFLSVIKTGFRYFRDATTNRQTRNRSFTVAKEHYDAGNELYRRMLDPTMTYTSGIWAPGYDLEDAQNAKYDLIARKMGLKPGDRVLDIGSGFGGFARFASKYYGAKVTGITISIEQLKAARALSAGDDNINFVFSDYRDIPYRFPPNTFDHVVSIEMIEAVGPKNLKEYFQAASASLKEGGRLVIQDISETNDVVNSNPWFSKYIFRDGVAPSNHQLDEAAAGPFGAPADRQDITENYDKTLMAWHDNFTKAWPVLKESYGDRFKRMWDFYLLSIAGGFRANAMHLNQVIYVKGGDSALVPKVRDLPTRERLDAMKATDQDKERTAFLIGDQEKKNQAMKENLKATPPQQPQVPMSKNVRIAIIGAGPGGLGSALELRTLGYNNVSIFEKEAEAGGKSHTVNIGGRAQDLGATMGVPLKYSDVEHLAQQQGVKQISFPQQVYYDLQTGRPAAPKTVGESAKLAYQGLIYLIHRLRLGSHGIEVPTDEMADPWSVVLGRSGLGYFADQTSTYLTGYGYGTPETPAVFGLRLFDANAVVGSALAAPIMWQDGSQAIWKNLAVNLGVQTNSEISRIDRTGGSVHLYFKDGRAPEEFDQIIFAGDPKSALQVLDATPEEQSLFSQVKYMPYSTFAVRVEGFAQGRAEVGYIKENMTPERAGRPMAWIKRYADDNVFIFHLLAPGNLSDNQIMENISQDMKRLGATKLTLLDSRRWPFFPHVDAQAMREEHFFQRAANLQGQNHTYFVNEALGMSTMADAFAQGKRVAQHMATGHN